MNASVVPMLKDANASRGGSEQANATEREVAAR